MLCLKLTHENWQESLVVDCAKHCLNVKEDEERIDGSLANPAAWSWYISKTTINAHQSICERFLVFEWLYLFGNSWHYISRGLPFPCLSILHAHTHAFTFLPHLLQPHKYAWHPSIHYLYFLSVKGRRDAGTNPSWLHARPWVGYQSIPGLTQTLTAIHTRIHTYRQFWVARSLSRGRNPRGKTMQTWWELVQKCPGLLV